MSQIKCKIHLDVTSGIAKLIINSGIKLRVANSALTQGRETVQGRAFTWQMW
jgi:hypothetical protein